MATGRKFSPTPSWPPSLWPPVPYVWEESYLQILYDMLNLIDVKTNGTLKRQLHALDASKPAIVFSFPDDSECAKAYGCHLWPDAERSYLDTHTIFLLPKSATTSTPWEDGFKWTIVHEVGHVMNHESGGSYASTMGMISKILVLACHPEGPGPTWYGETNPRGPRNVYEYGKSEDFSDSLALYVLGKNNNFFDLRQAKGKIQLVPGGTEYDVKDGRPGIPWRMDYVHSLFR